jgi:hypothetical protein
MNISATQKATIADWVKDGQSIAAIQARLRDEMQLSLTYMDVRFLVDDLDIVFSEPEPEPEPSSPSASDESTPDSDVVEEPEVVGGDVRVEVDPVTPPGALVSGTVNFSDGKQMAWQLSAAGQLGLVPGDDPDYRPSPEDVQAFQAQLQQVLQKHGY